MQWIYNLSIFKNNNISYLNLFGEQNKCNEFIIYLFKKNNISYLNLFGWGKHVLNSYIKGGFFILFYFLFFKVCVWGWGGGGCSTKAIKKC